MIIERNADTFLSVSKNIGKTKFTEIVYHQVRDECVLSSNSYKNVKTFKYLDLGELSILMLTHTVLESSHFNNYSLYATNISLVTECLQ